MGFPIKILIVEDSSDDVLLIMDALRDGGYDPTFERVDTYDNLKSALINQWDIIIADYNMPAFSGIAALELVRKQGVDTPFIIVSGTISDNTAVNAMRSGPKIM